jgi:CheY-like chemotaxis protein
MTARDIDDMVLLMADDDDDDYLLTRNALKKSHLLNPLVRVSDGEELLEFLQKTGRYEGKDVPRPNVILLDLNMPKVDGREALSRIKSDEDLKHIPIVVFTTSKAEEDIIRSYQLGVNSFITKPVTLDSLIDVMQTLGNYWFKIVELPPDDTAHA